MADFDFGQFFGGSDTNTQGSPFGSPESIQNILSSIAQKNDGPITEEEAKSAFEEKYKSPENFVENYFDKMVEPYENGILQGLSTVAETRLKSGENKTYLTLLTAASVEAARQFNMKMLLDNDTHRGQDTAHTSLKAALLGASINEMIPNNTPQDGLIAVHALLGIVTLKLAELTMQLEAQELAKEARNN